jgi:hypothetical protein
VDDEPALLKSFEAPAAPADRITARRADRGGHGLGGQGSPAGEQGPDPVRQALTGGSAADGNRHGVEPSPACDSDRNARTAVTCGDIEAGGASDLHVHMVNPGMEQPPP